MSGGAAPYKPWWGVGGVLSITYYLQQQVAENQTIEF